MRKFLSAMPIERFVHGGAGGCDTLAHNIVRHAFPDIPIEIHPAAGSPRGPELTFPGGNLEIFAELPPLERNRVIVSRIHGLLAVPEHDVEIVRSGTWSTVRRARKLGVPVYIVKRNGEIVRDA